MLTLRDEAWASANTQQRSLSLLNYYNVSVAHEAGIGENIETRSRGDDLVLQCLKCGYVLRGLDVAKQCPECGTSIEASVKLFASPEVLAKGFKYLGWSYASLFVWLLLFIAPLFFYSL